MSTTISLTKGAKLSLTKPGENSPTSVFVGCGWDPDPSAGSIDLDLSAALFDENKNLLDTVWFSAKHSSRDPIYSNGDNLTGDGDGDDEVIAVKLDKIAANVKSIVFVINSYKGQTFDKIRNAFARLVDVSNGSEDVKYRYDVSGMGKSTGLVMVKLYRHNGEWKINAIGETLPELTRGSTVKDTIELIKKTYL
ncbi:TerD family protein [bacterium]|nr:TerD family protein [bacterium]MBP9810437.1 TerD family protein [bacterium]